MITSIHPKALNLLKYRITSPIPRFKIRKLNPENGIVKVVQKFPQFYNTFTRKFIICAVELIISLPGEIKEVLDIR